MDSNGIAKLFKQDAQRIRKPAPQSSARPARPHHSSISVASHKRHAARHTAPSKKPKSIGQRAAQNQTPTSRMPLAYDSYKGLREMNRCLKHKYELAVSMHETKNYFRQTPAMPDLYKYYCNIVDHQASDKRVAKALKNRSRLISLLCSRDSRLFSFNQHRAFRIPFYINGGLSEIIKILKSVNRGDRRHYIDYPSVVTLSHRLLQPGMFSKSSTSLLMLMGLFKPDKILQMHLLEKVMDDSKAKEMLLKSGHLTPDTVGNFDYTTFSYPTNIVLLLNDAGTDLMRKFFKRNHADNLYNYNQHISQSCENRSYFSGGAYAKMASYTSKSIDLICWKLQDAMFGKVIKR